MAIESNEKNLQVLSQHGQLESLRQILGPSPAVSHLIADIARVAKSNFSVVILGETGSGKEEVAGAVHQASAYSGGPFVPVDCGAIPETLLEAELFGHERGAFTSADSRQLGKFEVARGGTLLLDEVSNLPLGSQAKLLRALQEKTIFRIGGTRPISVDVRVLVASNQNLLTLAKAGAFRHDLYFRLSEFTIRVPPLRERREDILYLAQRFLDITNAELRKNVRGLAESAIALLLPYDWPGNVRELRSCIRRAVLLADDVITEQHLDIAGTCGSTAAEVSPPPTPADGLPLKEIVRRNTRQVEREVIVRVLRRTGGNKAAAARLLQIDYKTMHSKVREYGIGSGREEYE